MKKSSIYKMKFLLVNQPEDKLAKWSSIPFKWLSHFYFLASVGFDDDLNFWQRIKIFDSSPLRIYYVAYVDMKNFLAIEINIGCSD